MREDAGVTRCADGLALDGDLLRAAEQATRQALGRLGRAPDLAAVFVCGAVPDETAAALERAAALSGARTTLGCSTAGVIADGRGTERRSSVAVWLAELPGASLRSFHLEVIRTSDSIAVLGMPPVTGHARAAVVLADPYSFPVEAFVEQANDVLPGLPLSGGLAAGSLGPGSTRLLVDGVVHDRGAVGVVLGGDVAVTALVSQGCRPVGPPMTVTAAEGNVVLELASMAAADKLAQVLSDLAPEEQALVSAGLQLGIAVDENAEELASGDFLVRGVVGADTRRGGLVVGDAVTLGCTVQFQARDPDAADAELAAVLDRAHRRGPVHGALLFSCTGRGSAMFADADHDVQRVRDGLRSPAVAGFFAGGEIGPVAGRNHVHGFTASVLAFGEGAPDRLRP